jgi:hypothetical protein
MIKCRKDKVLVKVRQKMAKRYILNSEKTNINHLYLEKIVQLMQKIVLQSYVIFFNKLAYTDVQINRTNVNSENINNSKA